MGRPPRHDVDRLLDAAAALVAEGGPGAATMTAVARAAGAPSGSVYHRFAGRPALLAALWLRTVDRFQQGFLAALDTDPPAQAAPAAARHVIAWCRAHPHEARILLYGPADFDHAHWPDQARDRLAAANERIAAALRALAARLGRSSPHDLERLTLAAVDIPYATVRRHQSAGTPLPDYAEDLVTSCAIAVAG